MASKIYKNDCNDCNSVDAGSAGNFNTLSNRQWYILILDKIDHHPIHLGIDVDVFCSNPYKIIQRDT